MATRGEVGSADGRVTTRLMLLTWVVAVSLLVSVMVGGRLLRCAWSVGEGLVCTGSFFVPGHAFLTAPAFQDTQNIRLPFFECHGIFPVRTAK